MGKKVRRIVFTIVVLLAGMIGCGVKEEKNQMELLPVSREEFYYEGTAEAEKLAVDENGTLYSLQQIKKLYYLPGESMDYTKWRISVYALDGSCIASEEVAFGNSNLASVTVKDGVLYLVSGKTITDGIMAVYAVDTATWEVKLITTLSQYESGSGPLYAEIVDQYLYVLMNRKNADSVEDMESLDNIAKTYRNSVVFRLNLSVEHPLPQAMTIEFPSALYLTEQNTLMIQTYDMQTGFHFMDFDHEEGTLIERNRMQGVDFRLVYVSGSCADGVFLIKRSGYGDEKELFYYPYGMEETGEEQLMLLSGIECDTPAEYQKGFIFFINKTDKTGIYRICVENVVNRSNTIRLLEIGDMRDKPYPCGFLIKEMKVSEEVFALKAMAGDRDFDVYSLRSSKQISYELKENGGYYPLNEVEGVKEYLDSCFPYIRELATNENGDIWMLPVQTEVLALIYNKEYCKKQGVDLENMDWAEFVDLLTKVYLNEEEKEKIVDMGIENMIYEFSSQYLSLYDTFDTEEFRLYAKQLRNSRETGWTDPVFLDVTDVSKNKVPEFYFWEVYGMFQFENLAEILGTMDVYGAAGVPNISGRSGNTAYVSFLVVNPNSQNREKSLEYISAYAKYLLKKENTFMLEDVSSYTDTPFLKEMYKVFSDANVSFALEDEVYFSTFEQYIYGEKELEETITEMERKWKMYRNQ